MRGFVQTNYAVPPGGFWFYELNGERVEHPIYDMAVRRVGELMAKHGVSGSAADALAEYMCPHMPSWFCTGDGPVSPVITGHEARTNAEPYFPKDVVPFDIISKRMERCMLCPKHRRDFCLHCHGHDAWIYSKFGGRRPRLPADDASGCCSCAKTFEAAIASVDFKKGDIVWEGVPDTCWRKDE